jgi:hypothetical protein
VDVLRQRKIFGALSVGALTIAAQALFPALGKSADQTLPIPIRPGSPAQLVIPLDAPNGRPVLDIALDDANRRVFVTVEQSNAVQVFGYDGTPSGSVPLVRAGSMSTGTDGIYAVDEGRGAVVRIDPATLATTTVTAEMPTPRGLTYNGGLLYTVVSTGPLSDDRAIVAIDPTTGSTKLVSEPASPIGRLFENLMDPSPQSGVLFGTATGLGPQGLSKLDTKDITSYVHIHNEFACEAALDDGEVLVGRTDEFFAINSDTMSDSFRRWPSPENTYPASCAAAGGVVALTSRSFETESASAVQVFDQRNPGQLLKSFAFTAGQLAGPTASTKDGALVLVPMRFGANLELHGLKVTTDFFPRVPPVDLEPIMTAPTPVFDPTVPPTIPVAPNPTSRNRAPSSGTVSTIKGRIGAPLDPVLAKLATVDDWMIAPDGRHVLALSTKQGRVVVFDANGAVVASIDQLAQPSAMTVCNGVPSIALFGSSEIVSLGPSLSSPQISFSTVPRVRSLSCVGSTVYAFSAPPRANSGQAASIWTLINPKKSMSFPTTEATFARYGLFDNLIANVGNNFGRYDPLTLREFTPIDNYYPAGPLRPAQPLHATADGSKFLDYAGRQFDVGTLRPTGLQFPGSNVVISETTPAYVATRPTGANNILILAGDDPKQVFRQLTISPSFTLLDVEFVPKTNTMFALVRRSFDHEYFVRALPDIVTGVGSQTDPISIEMFAPVVPAHR